MYKYRTPENEYSSICNTKYINVLFIDVLFIENIEKKSLKRKLESRQKMDVITCSSSY